MKRMLDLCSGLGGASQAFVDAEDWSVIRIEINPLLADIPHTQITDIADLTEVSGQNITLIWASPPCRDFSQAYGAPKSEARRSGIEYEPDMELVTRCKEIIEEAKPEYWIIENVVGAIKSFEELLGRPMQIIGPFVLWGNVPLIHMPPYWSHSKLTDDKHSRHLLRSQHRAKIPPDLSRAVLEAVSIKTLHDYPPIDVNDTN